MIVGLVMDQDGRPLCSELWPGNTADVTTLLPLRRQGIAAEWDDILCDLDRLQEITIEQEGKHFLLLGTGEFDQGIDRNSGDAEWNLDGGGIRVRRLV